MNKDLARFPAIWRALSGYGLAAFTACLHVVKEPPKIVFAAGFWVRRWRRAQFSMLHCRGIIAGLGISVCEGGTRKM
jgi:hypothetical protein